MPPDENSFASQSQLVTTVAQASHNRQIDWDESHLEDLDEVKVFRSLR